MLGKKELSIFHLGLKMKESFWDPLLPIDRVQNEMLILAYCSRHCKVTWDSACAAPRMHCRVYNSYWNACEQVSTRNFDNSDLPFLCKLYTFRWEDVEISEEVPSGHELDFSSSYWAKFAVYNRVNPCNRASRVAEWRSRLVPYT